MERKQHENREKRENGSERIKRDRLFCLWLPVFYDTTAKRDRFFPELREFTVNFLISV